MPHTTTPDGRRNHEVSPLRCLRLNSGVSASDFARMVGIDLSALYCYETGSRLPGAKYKRALAEMGVNIQAVLARHVAWCETQSTQLRNYHAVGLRAAAER